MMENRSGTGSGRLLAQRLRVPEVLDVHRRAAEVVNDSDDIEVTLHGFCAKDDGSKEEDDGWISVGGRGD